MHDLDFIDKEISKAFKFINEDKFKEAEQTIEGLLKEQETEENLKANHLQNIADICLILGKFELARNMYIKANNLAGAAFSFILLKEIQKAKEVLVNTPDSPAKFWCEFLVDLFSEKNNIQKYPSFFEIRHFLELTVYLLLRSKNQHYINLIVKNLNKLLKINLDSEKFIGYAYFHFGDLENALSLLTNSIKKNQYDGEIYFMLGKLYLQKGSAHDALAMLENARLFLPDHAPTRDLLEKIKSTL